MIGHPFVGREQELHQLRAALAEAEAGRGGFVLLVGPAGIGKTRLAEEIDRDARARGATVLWGRCWEGDGAPPFGPWVHVLRTCLRLWPDDALRTFMAGGAADLARLVTEIRERLSDVAPATEVEPAQARARLFDSVAGFFQRLSRNQTLLLVLDDLHWADAASLRLLLFVAEALRNERAVLLATQRPDEPPRQTPAARSLGDVARAAERIELGGLGDGAVARVLEDLTGAQPPAGFVQALQGRTDGNPFFIREIVRLLGSEGHAYDATAVATMAVPRSVRDTVLRRLSRLPDPCRDALRIAAVIGNVFRAETVERVRRLVAAGGAEPPPLLPLLDQAAGVGLIDAGNRGVDTYSFTHALIRDSLYDDLGRAEQAPLHRWVAHVLAAQLDPGMRGEVAEVAHHYFQAALDGRSEPAIEFGLKAGAHASARFAYEEAAVQYRRVLELLARQQAPDSRRQCETLLALGEAVQNAGDEVQASEVLWRAADVARAHGLREHLAQAALLRATRMPTGSGDPPTLAALEEALAGLGEENTALRARLVTHLASVLSPSAHARRLSLGTRAVDIARRSGDRRALAEALVGWHWTAWSPSNLDERLAVATEVIGLCQGGLIDGNALRGYGLRVVNRLEMGDVRGVDADIAAQRRLAEGIRNPTLLWLTLLHEALQAFLNGRFADAESRAQRALAAGQHVNGASAMQYYGAQLFALRREQGRLDELEATAQALADTHATNPGWRASLAYLFGEIGRTAEARQELDILAARDFDDVAFDYNWLITMAFLSQAAAVTEDRARAAAIYERLLPFADRHVVVAPGIACTGSVSHNLGVLAALLNQPEAAATHFEAAITMNLRLGHGPLAAHTQREYATMLVQQANSDRQRARDLLVAAAETYSRLDMASYAAVVARLMERAAPDGAPTMSAPVRGEGQLLHRQGDFWTIRYAGRSVQVKQAKGMSYLACLMRAPGRSVHVLDLTAMGDASRSTRQAATARAQPGRLSDEGLSPGAPGTQRPRADMRATAAYRRRLEDLRGELEEAEAFNDQGRAAHLRTELDFLMTELASAYGVGASRRSTEPTEKARKAVTNRIRAAVRHLESLHVALGRHLSASLELGTFCRYDPPEPTSWDVRS